MVVRYGDSNMKETIKGVLEDIADSQPNLHSEASREMIANLITAALKSKDDLGVDEYPYSSDFGDKEREVEKAKWVCSFCGKNTYNVDFDYIGSEYNHLGCELEVEMREKNWLQEKHEDKVFNQAAFGDSKDLTEAKIQANSDHNDGWVKKHYEDKLSEAIVDNKKEKYIYESPDGGKTVYRRKFGEDKRELVDTKEWKKKLS